MSFVTELAMRSLKTNKRKNILVWITIVLTVLLLTVVGMVCVSWSSVDKAMAIENIGAYHGVYKNLNFTETRILKNNLELQQVGLTSKVGEVDYGDVRLEVKFLDENAVEMSEVEIIEGAMPKNENEIAIQKGYIDKLGDEINLGDKIKLQYKDLVSEKNIEKEFYISGILENYGQGLWNEKCLVVVSWEFLKINSVDQIKNYEAYVRVKGEGELSGKKIENLISRIAQDVGIDKYDVKINDEYIHSIMLNMPLIGGAIIVGIVVLLCSSLVIYSIFYVSIVAKVKEYGRLKALGATERQIRGIVLREGLFIAMIAIPVGIGIGYIVGSFVVDYAVTQGGYQVNKLNWFVVACVFVFSILSVLVALIKPMKIAAKISPVEAMEIEGECFRANREREGYDFLNLTRLTYANIVRNKKRTVITMISLTVSGVLFMAMSTILGSLSGEAFVKSHMEGDFILSLNNYTFEDEAGLGKQNIIQSGNPLGESVRNEIMQLPGIKGVKKGGMVLVDYELPSGKIEASGIGGFDAKGFKWLEENLIEGCIDYERLMKGEGIIFTYPNYAEEYGVVVGKKIKLKIYDGSSTYYKEFVVDGIAEVGGEVFLLPDSTLYNMVRNDITNRVEVMVEDDYVGQTEVVLKDMAGKSPYIDLKSMNEEIAIYEDVMKLIKNLGYSLVFIIGIIGFINLINTLIVSVINRRREFGVLQAVGLSNKQLIKMLQLEGLFYSVGMLVSTLTVGNVVGYILFKVFTNSGADYAIYRYPLVQTIILIIAVVGVQLILTWSISRCFNKESIVDRIRYDKW